MSSLGKLTYYLGNQVHQHEEEIMLKQDRYAHMDLNVNLSKFPEYRSIEEKEYRRSIGCLRQLVFDILFHTRPDLSYSVGVLNSYILT